MLGVKFKQSFGSLFVVLLCTVIRGADAGTNEDGLAFLRENEKLPGVVTLPSGLQYKVLTDGPGLFHPAINSPCSCHYEGKLTDGSVFDSSYDRGSPTTFAPNQVIKGWTEVMQLMVVGDKWELYIPSELGYGDSGSPPKIPGGAVLVFTMEILDIDGDTKDLVPAQKCDVVSKEKCNDKQTKYLQKVSDWSNDKKASELSRLSGLLQQSSSMKADLVHWVQSRMHLLQQLGPLDTANSEAEL